ncbi:hypothetical protein [Methylobacterium sp. E-045]|uniref:hypothetical protein n=1 Tax=Methylobacterium sp. E-045 TaxID=2836575 RepID=UPI001FBB2382|nr:hypothetical protein [Methylobacterium sp. E-045]MCJ2127988.1 hypothetical protein [Methylobacterium sp. E-045]
MTIADDAYVYDIPSEQALDRLIRWHDRRANGDSRLALGLEAEGLDKAADTNRQRSAAHRQTATYLKAFRERQMPPKAEFRDHLKATARPKARVRAPP